MANIWFEVERWEGEGIYKRKEEDAVRQERQVPLKARKSWNELMRAMI